MRIVDVIAFMTGAWIGAQAMPRPSGDDAPAHSVVVATAQAAAAPPVAQASSKRARKDDAVDAFAPRTQRFIVTFKHAHSKERLPFASVSSQDELSRFLRCRATSHQTEMAPGLAPIAASIARELGADAIEVVSGYRSPKLNEMLRKKGRQVASESQHTHGQALDFAVAGANARVLARMAEARHRGGIGTYVQSGFIHIDTGRNRRWSGR